MDEDAQSPHGESVEVEGRCHCGVVRFRVRLPRRAAILQSCNCSICSMTGFMHLIVPAWAFELRSGAGQLTEYRFHTRTARHLFCRVCGVKSFYVPRSNPDGYSVNANCLDWPEGFERVVEAIDGRNWRSGAAHLGHLTSERTGQ